MWQENDKTAYVKTCVLENSLKVSHFKQMSLLLIPSFQNTNGRKEKLQVQPWEAQLMGKKENPTDSFNLPRWFLLDIVSKDLMLSLSYCSSLF